MFKNQRFLTKGIRANLPTELVIFLWQLIDERLQLGAELDYLQVFKLSSQTDAQGNQIQKVEHSQEVPPSKASYLLEIKYGPISAKVFVIDDLTHSTMLLAEEY